MFVWAGVRSLLVLLVWLVRLVLLVLLMYVCSSSSSNLFSNIKVACEDHKKIWDKLFRRPNLGGNHCQ
jgi:hypothetical protein